VKKVQTVLIAIALGGVGVLGRAQGGDRSPTDGMDGAALFKTYCSSCHGKGAKGDGPIADALRYRPADLTALARRAKGHFDRQAIHRMIDGRVPVKGHGGPDMPLWGDAFKRSGDGYSEQAVHERIDLLVAYLEGLQQP
jgi:mono/diheme cytochrome c family protein